jgi:uncharacterized hydrophobic protein (TIGR00271 family)
MDTAGDCATMHPFIVAMELDVLLMTDVPTPLAQSAENPKPAKNADTDKKAEKQKANLPSYAHTVVVPIANPQTATELIRLAKATVQRDGGRVIALAITLSDSDAEESRERLDTLEALVEEHKAKPKDELKAEPMNEAKAEDDVAVTEPKAQADSDARAKPKNPPVTVDFVTRTAMSIARGILDEARESGAELLILGAYRPHHDGVVLGSVARSIISAPPCDILIYRHSESPEFNRILIPVDGSAAASMAVRMGIVFANSRPNCPVEAVFVQESHRPDYEGHSHIQQTLAGVPGQGIVKRTVLRAYNPAQAILARIDEDHLVIVGFTQNSAFQHWLDDGDKEMRELLDRAPGPMLIAVRSTETVTQQRRLLRRALSWLRPTLTDIEQEQIGWQADDNANTNLDYVMLMLIAATIATLGLLLNSAAVIIGAMLVAPLIAPLTAIGIGLTTARLRMVGRAIATVLIGIGIACAVSIGIGLLVPVESPTPEVMSRVSPTLLDAFVALAAGVVGAYASARKDIPAALAGVAIAAALVPPICTFGLQFAQGNWVWALGAMLLFLTNMFSIIVISVLLFLWLGIRPQGSVPQGARYGAALIAFLMTLPLALSIVYVSQRSDRRVIEDEILALLAPVRIANMSVDSLAPYTITATLRTPNDISPEAVAVLREEIATELDNPNVQLHLVVEKVLLTPDDLNEWERRYGSPVGESPLEVRDGVVVPIADGEPPAPVADDSPSAAVTQEATEAATP